MSPPLPLALTSRPHHLITIISHHHQSSSPSSYLHVSLSLPQPNQHLIPLNFPLSHYHHHPSLPSSHLDRHTPSSSSGLLPSFASTIIINQHPLSSPTAKVTLSYCYCYFILVYLFSLVLKMNSLDNLCNLISNMCE